MAFPMLPLSARDTIEFRPAATAVITAREALEQAEAALDVADAGPELVEARNAAQAALDAAQAALDKGDRVYVLKVPTGRTRALVNHDLYADPDAPKFLGNPELIAAVEAEADAAGLSAAEIDTLAKAKTCTDAGKDIPAELWAEVYAVTQATHAGRRIVADRILFGELLARHRVRHHLVLPGRRSPLSERDLDSVDMQDLAAINGEILRLSDLSETDAKNSVAP